MKNSFTQFWKRMFMESPAHQHSMMTLLRIILSDTNKITKEVQILMATVQELSSKLDVLSNTITAERAEVVAGLQVLKDQITALQEQVGAGSPATQADLNLFAARVDEQMNRVKGIITDGDI